MAYGLQNTQDEVQRGMDVITGKETLDPQILRGLTDYTMAEKDNPKLKYTDLDPSESALPIPGFETGLPGLPLNPDAGPQPTSLWTKDALAENMDTILQTETFWQPTEDGVMLMRKQQGGLSRPVRRRNGESVKYTQEELMLINAGVDASYKPTTEAIKATPITLF